MERFHWRLQSMQIYWNKIIFYVRKVFNSHRIGLECQYGRRVIVLKHQMNMAAVTSREGIHLQFRLFALDRRTCLGRAV